MIVYSSPLMPLSVLKTEKHIIVTMLGRPHLYMSLPDYSSFLVGMDFARAAFQNIWDFDYWIASEAAAIMDLRVKPRLERETADFMAKS